MGDAAMQDQSRCARTLYEGRVIELGSDFSRSSIARIESRISRFIVDDDDLPILLVINSRSRSTRDSLMQAFHLACIIQGAEVAIHAEVRGDCLGAAFYVLIACHTRYATYNSRFALDHRPLRLHADSWPDTIEHEYRKATEFASLQYGDCRVMTILGAIMHGIVDEIVEPIAA